MINDILILRSLLPDPDILELDDEKEVSGITAFGWWLQTATYQVEETMRKWLGRDPVAGQKTEAAEILLIKALVLEDHGFMEMLSQSEIRAGGAQGMQVRFVRVPEEERGQAISHLRDRAYGMLTGKSAGTFCGVI